VLPDVHQSKEFELFRLFGYISHSVPCFKLSRYRICTRLTSDVAEMIVITDELFSVRRRQQAKQSVQRKNQSAAVLTHGFSYSLKKKNAKEEVVVSLRPRLNT